MPIYEYYCPDNNRIYQFYAKTLAQGRTVPKCPDNPAYRMEKVLSAFSVVGRRTGGRAPEESDPSQAGTEPAGTADQDDPRMESVMNAMEGQFANVDENDPRAMGRMMRRMAELTGEKLDGGMEEVVRKLEEGADPESLEDQLGAGETGVGDEEAAPPPPDAPGPRARSRLRRGAPVRDPKLYDYEP